MTPKELKHRQRYIDLLNVRKLREELAQEREGRQKLAADIPRITEQAEAKSRVFARHVNTLLWIVDDLHSQLEKAKKGTP